MSNSSLGEAVLDLTADDSRMEKDIEKAKGKVLTKLNEIATDMKRIGQSMTIALSLPLIALGTFAVDAASDLDETKNKVRVVFGEMGEALIEWSEDSATALGQSQEQALAAAATYGNMFVTMGMVPQAAADMSMSLVELASDMASFNNASPEEVLAAIQSGLVGQSEPLRKYGVMLTEVAVQEKAMAMGLAEAADELTEADKAQARYALILEQTATAQGDFARTSEGLANQTRIMKAELANAAATLGVQLLPYAIKFMELLSMLIERFKALTPEQQKWVVIIGVIVAAVGPLLLILGSLITAFTAIAGVIGAISLPVILVIAAVAGLIAIGYAWYLAWQNNLMGIQDRLNQFVNIWRTSVLPVIQAVWGWMSGTLFPFLQALANFISAVFGVALRAMAGIWQNILLPALTAVFNVVASKLMPIFQALASFYRSTLEPILQAIAMWVGQKVAGAFTSLTTTLQTVTTWLNKVAGMLNGMTLPAWMTPGSPTPWEVGLWGVNDALKAVGKMGLPTLSSAMGAMSAPAIAGGGGMALSSAGAGMPAMQFVYQPFIGVNDEYEAKNKLRSIVNDIQREQRK